jgi:hypothetical protein
VGENATAWSANPGELKSSTTEITDEKFRFSSSDGSYVEMVPSATGIKWHKTEGDAGKDYHYLAKAGEGTTYPNADKFVTVQLPDEFKGKNFEVAVGLQRTIPNGTVNLIMYVEVSLYSKDIANGRFTVYGSCTLVPRSNIPGPTTTGWADFSYVAIA